MKAALQEAAKKREMRYSDLKKIEKGIRRHFHDDITVVVLYLDHEVMAKGCNVTPLSVKACSETTNSVHGANIPHDLFTTGGGLPARTDDAPRS